MRKHYKYILAALTAGAFLPAAAQEKADSSENKSTVLEEVVVEGRLRRLTSEGVEIVPTKEDKKYSWDSYSLLRRLQIPYLNTAINGEVKTTTGQDVTYYIDFRPASEGELATLQTKDVLRVDYMENPSDPRLAGSRNVINFIMQQYEWGGYTNLKAEQYFILPLGNYKLASRFKTKRTTLDFYGKGSYYSEPRGSWEATEKFSDIFFENTHYDLIERISNGSSDSKNRNFSGNFKVTTDLDKEGYSYMVHGVTFSFTRNPETEYHSTVKYSPEIAPESPAINVADGSSLSPRLYGLYFWSRGSDSYKLNWSGTYAYNKNNSSYAEEFFPAIINNTREKAADARVNFNFTHKFSNGGMLNVNPMFNGNWYFTDYSGSNNSDQRLFKTEDLLLVTYQQQISKVYLTVRGGVSFSSWKVNHEGSETKWNPRFYADASYLPNSKHRITAQYAWGNSSPENGFSNTVLRQTSTLMWIQGNPFLKVSDMMTASLGYTYMPIQKISISANYQTDMLYHATQFRWLPAPEKLGGLLRTAASTGEIWNNKVLVYCSYQTQLTPGSGLGLDGIAQYLNYRNRGVERLSLNSTQFTISGRYWNNGFGVNLSVMTPSKSLDKSNLSAKDPWYFHVEGYWFYNDFLFEVMYGQGFSKLWKKESALNTPYYAYNMTSNSTGAYFSVSVSYTFSYGKKVQKDYNTYESGIKSSVLQ